MSPSKNPPDGKDSNERLRRATGTSRASNSTRSDLLRFSSPCDWRRISGRVISQTGGHGDFRAATDVELPVCGCQLHTDRQGAPGTALPDHSTDDGCTERRHDEQAARDRLTLATLFRIYTWIGSWRINQRDNR